jgi:hypothetical protein
MSDFLFTLMLLGTFVALALLVRAADRLLERRENRRARGRRQA